MNPSFSLGWEEWLSLPDIGLSAVKAKVDTGAKTSALHASRIEPFGTEDQPMVRFHIQPNPDNVDLDIICEAPIVDRRPVTSSNGEMEIRYVISTNVKIGEREWPIEVTLTNRESMAYRMLLGRSAIDDDMIVDPNSSFLQPKLSYKSYDVGRTAPAPSRALEIALLTLEPHNYTSQRIQEAARKRGHNIRAINTTRCYLKMDEISSEVHYDGAPLPRFDAVVPRIGARTTAYGMAVLRQFAGTGAYCVNTAEAIGASRDKLLAHQILASAKIGTPVTAFANSPKDTKHLIELIGGAPAVLKLLSSTQGRGVVLAETRKAAESLVDAFRGLDANFLIQEFVAESAGADTRCLVIGDEVVGCIQRKAVDGEFRSNLHRGGSAYPVEASDAIKDVALRATKLMGLTVAGVDILESNSGPKVLEVNSSPGFEGIEKAIGVDIADLLIQHLEKRTYPVTMSV